jgi:RNA polymerase sigma factor (sigma-70 family)
MKASKMTESEIISGCIANNRLAQKTLYERYKRAMFTLAYRITNDFDDANDVLQDAFMDVFEDIGQFRRESTLGAFIKTIVVRKASKKIKKNKPFVLLEELPEIEPVIFENEIDAEKIENAIQSLPDGYRTVFVLIEMEGYSHKEVAQMLGISESGSKSQLSHAKKKLRELLS